MSEDDFRYQALKQVTGGWYKNDIRRLHKLFLKIGLLKKNPTKAIEIILKFCSSLRKKIEGTETFSETLILIAQKSLDIEDLIMNVDEGSFGEYHLNRNYEKPDDVLTLANIHQIKGKEFKVVFVLGSYDTVFKQHGTFESKDTMIDEIFVMNVAVTRSRKYLYFLFPMTHKDWKNKAHPNNPSIFVRKSPQKLFEVYTVSHFQPPTK